MNKIAVIRLLGYVATMSLIVLIGWAIISANVGANSLPEKITRAIPWGDKLGHAGLFGTLAALLYWLTGFRCWTVGKIPVPAAPLLVVVFAFAEELSQLSLQNRTFELRDALADIVGVVIGVALVKSLRNRRRSG